MAKRKKGNDSPGKLTKKQKGKDKAVPSDQRQITDFFSKPMQSSSPTHQVGSSGRGTALSRYLQLQHSAEAMFPVRPTTGPSTAGQYIRGLSLPVSSTTDPTTSYKNHPKNKHTLIDDDYDDFVMPPSPHLLSTKTHSSPLDKGKHKHKPYITDSDDVSMGEASSTRSNTGLTTTLHQGLTIGSESSLIASVGTNTTESDRSSYTNTGTGIRKNISLKYQKKKDKREALKEARKTELSKTDKKRKCSKCGKEGHTSWSNEDCDSHIDYLNKEGRSRYTIKTSLKNTINLGSNIRKNAFRNAQINTVKHIRDVTYVLSLFMNYYCLEYLEKQEEIPSLNHSVIYDAASLIMGLGSHTIQPIRDSFDRFKTNLINSYNPQRFLNQKYTKIISQVCRSYEALIRNHVSDNYKRRTIRYFWTCLIKDNVYKIECLTSTAKKLANIMFEQLSSEEDLVISDELALTLEQKQKVNELRDDSLALMGDGPFTDKDIYTHAIDHLPWLYHVLAYMEQISFVREPKPESKVRIGYIHHNLKSLLDIGSFQKKFKNTLKLLIKEAINSKESTKKFVERSFERHKYTKIGKNTRDPIRLQQRQDLTTDEKKAIDAFVDTTRVDTSNKIFRPKKYTDPRGSRLFTMLPIFSLQMRHIQIDIASLKRLLKQSCGITYKGDSSMNDICSSTFNMSNIGFKRLSQLKEVAGRKGFAGVIRSDGYDLEFICTRPTRTYSQPLTPSELSEKVQLNEATIWGVDPGLRDIFVASDGDSSEKHRIRKTSTAEYYHLLGSDRQRILQAKLKRSRPDARRIINETPTFKTNSVAQFIIATTYVLRNYTTMTQYYDENQLFNKLKFEKYITKQKTIHEICSRLTTVSRKYRHGSSAVQVQQNTPRPTNLPPSTKKKWTSLHSEDKDDEDKKTIVIAFGAAQFGNLRGNVPAPTKLIKKALKHFVKKRKAPTFLVYVDEYLTSQICPTCETRTTKNEVDASADVIFPVKVCSTCNKHYNRNHMASMNIRKVFLHMAANNDQRPSAFLQ